MCEPLLQPELRCLAVIHQHSQDQKPIRAPMMAGRLVAILHEQLHTLHQADSV